MPRQTVSTRVVRRTSSPTSAVRAPAPTTFAKVLRVLCVDDHAVLVEGLRAQFAIEGDIEIVGQLSSATRLLDEVRRLEPDAVILDIEMPGPDAFEAADRLHQAHPEVRVIVLSAHVRDAYISASFRAGACAYFSKSDELGDIVQGIARVCRRRGGSFLLGPKVLRQARPEAPPSSDTDDGTGKTSAPPISLLTTLTPREAEVLRLIGKGLSRQDIAKQICRSVKTVDGHQDRLMRKLGIPTRTGLVLFAIREGVAQL